MPASDPAASHVKNPQFMRPVDLARPPSMEPLPDGVSVI